MRDIFRVASLHAIITLATIEACAASEFPAFALPARALATNAASVYLKNSSLVPAAPVSVSLPQSPPPAVDFVALEDQFTVPDVHGAVGTNFVMAMHNIGVNVQTRLGVSVRAEPWNLRFGFCWVAMLQRDG